MTTRDAVTVEDFLWVGGKTLTSPMEGGSGAKIMLIVPATSESQAIARARVTISQLTDAAARPAQTFSDVRLVDGDDQTSSDTASGPAPADSRQGTELLESAIEETEEVFRENFETLRDSIECYGEDEILKNKDHVRDRFLSIGAFVGPAVRVYTHQARPLRCRDELATYRATHDSLWVVAARGSAPHRE